MPSFVKDKYFLLCLAAAFILLCSSFDNDMTDTKEIGIVYEITESKNGFVFCFENTDGEKMRCFSRSEPEEGSVYEISGNWSDDGTMFFTDFMTKLS